MGKINKSVTVSFWFIPAKFQDTILSLLEALWVCPAPLLCTSNIIFACTSHLWTSGGTNFFCTTKLDKYFCTFPQTQEALIILTQCSYSNLKVLKLISNFNAVIKKINK